MNFAGTLARASALAAAVAVSAWAGRADAAVLLTQGLNTSVNLAGTVAGTPLSATLGLNVITFTGSTLAIDFTVNNTTPSGTPGQNRLVSFAFDLTPDANRNITAASSNNGDWSITRNGMIPSAGTFDICAWDGQNCQGGGNQGIGEGLTESLRITMTGAFAQPLSLDNLVARYQSIGSAGDSGFIRETTTVPEPATLALLGTALIGLGAAGRRRRAENAVA